MQPNFTMEDLQNLGKLLIPQIEGILDIKLKPIHNKIDKVITILDSHTAILERHDQELKVLGAQHPSTRLRAGQKTVQVLVHKKVATAEELAIG